MDPRCYCQWMELEIFLLLEGSLGDFSTLWKKLRIFVVYISGKAWDISLAVSGGSCGWLAMKLGTCIQLRIRT